MDDVTLTHATGVISRIMEQVSLAITSNGRTVYEMAHMNIPAIVIPQHDREKTHDFACEENGFVALEPYKKGVTEQVVLEQLTRILDDQDYRRFLYDNTQKFLFHKNKTGVLKLIIDLLN
jgi:spore coat polysaccharide biosynthesis predicted glycosyltransferase SpsG